MKEKFGKLFRAQVSMKIVAFFAVLALAVVLLPIVRIMTNCVPWYDDFGYGQFTKNFWEIKHSFWDAIQGALFNTKTMWHAWQGTYTSCFFMSMMPAVWGTDKYAYGLWAILFLLVISIFCLTKILLKEVLKSTDSWSCLAVQAIVAATVVLFMRSAIEGFFWYNSAVHYTAMHSLGMLLVAGFIKLVYAKGKLQTLLLIVGSVFGAAIIGGVNNVTALQVGLVVIFALEPNKGGVYSSYCAYYFVHTGEAHNYYQEYLERVEICESDEADVVVRPYNFKPWLLCLGDLSDNPNNEPNRFMADFFYKNSITCIAPEETQE